MSCLGNLLCCCIINGPLHGEVMGDKGPVENYSIRAWFMASNPLCSPSINPLDGYYLSEEDSSGACLLFSCRLS